MVDECLLQGVQMIASAQSLNGNYVATRYPLDWHQAGADGLPVHQHGASAALSLAIAGLFGSGQIQVLAQHL
jgi:hypothetical protein